LINLALLIVYLIWGWQAALVGYGLTLAGYALWAMPRLRKVERRRVILYAEAQPYSLRGSPMGERNGSLLVSGVPTGQTEGAASTEVVDG
jgi:hypothetical protein